MIKDCNSCIHNRGGINCGLKSKYNDYKLEMEQLIEKWGEGSGFGFSLDCPSWYEEPNGKQVKHYTNPLPNNDKGKPNDWDEKDKNKIFKTEDIKVKPVSVRFGEDILESPYIKAKLNDDKYKDSIEILKSLVKSINEALGIKEEYLKGDKPKPPEIKIIRDFKFI